MANVSADPIIGTPLTVDTVGTDDTALYVCTAGIAGTVLLVLWVL